MFSSEIEFVISVDEADSDVERYLAEREKGFEIFETIRESIPQYPEEEVERDVAEAIAAVRAAKRAESGDTGKLE